MNRIQYLNERSKCNYTRFCVKICEYLTLEPMVPRYCDSLRIFQIWRYTVNLFLFLKTLFFNFPKNIF